MRQLMIALAVSLLAPGLVEARPPDHFRPAERNQMRYGGDTHRRAMPAPKMDSAVRARVREKLARADQCGRPSAFDSARMDRPATRSFGRSAAPAPNPYAKLEKAAVGKAMKNLSAKAHFAGDAKGLRSERAMRSGGVVGRALSAPNPYAKLEKAAVARAMQTLSAKAHFAGGAKGLSSGPSRSNDPAAAALVGSAVKIDRLGAANRSLLAGLVVSNEF